MIAERAMPAEPPRAPIDHRSSSLGAADQEIQRILQNARADVALLGLRLRSTLREAEEAERRAGAARSEEVEADLAGARATQERAMQRWIESRRRELALELEDVGREAAETIAEARREAVELIVRASNEIRQLFNDAGILSPDPAPTSPSFPEIEAVIRVDDPAPSRMAQPREAEAADSTTEVTGPPLDQWPAPAQDERWAPPASAPSVARRVERRRSTVQPSAPPQVATRRSWTAFFYLDVLLPLIAVAIVVIVLLAWIG